MSDPTQRNERGPSKRTGLLFIVGCLIAVAAIVAIVVATRSDESKPTPTMTVPTSPATTLVTDDAKIVADYKAFWDAYIAATNPMRPDYPGLQQHATGEELRKVVENLSGAKIDNLIFKGSLDINAKVLQKSGTTARLSDCMFDRGGQYDATTGERKDTQDSEPTLNTAELQLIDGTWKVASVVKEKVGCDGP